jgi:hypothetical protein
VVIKSKWPSNGLDSVNNTHGLFLAELSRETQQGKNGKRLLDTGSSEDVWKNYSLDDLEKTFCQEVRAEA